MSSSSRKIASARANGAKSKGPATDAGKQASARNALVHGLTAHTIVLFNEPADQYQDELAGYVDHFRPQTKPEADLVLQLAAAQWRLARYAGVESGLLEERMRDQEKRFGEELEGLAENQRLALAFDALVRDGGSLALLNRYQARLQNDYHRILKALMQMQSARAKQAQLPNEPNPDFEHRHPEPPPSPPATAASPDPPDANAPAHTCSTPPSHFDRIVAKGEIPCPTKPKMPRMHLKNADLTANPVSTADLCSTPSRVYRLDSPPPR